MLTLMKLSNNNLHNRSPQILFGNITNHPKQVKTISTTGIISRTTGAQQQISNVPARALR